MTARRRNSEIRRAAQRYADFHGEEAEHVEIMRGALPETYFLLGEIAAITYDVIENGIETRYHHEFEKPAALAISYDGKTALLTGGSWRFTDRGFIG